MADITASEMRELLLRLSDRLDTTSGDNNTAAKLEEIRKVLLTAQTDLSKTNVAKQNAALIGKAVADAISAKNINRPNTTTTNTTQSDIVDASVKKARQDFIDEYEKVTEALKTYGSNIGNGSGNRNNNALNPFNNNSAKEFNRLAAITDGIAAAGKGLIDGVKMAAQVMLQNVDTFRQMQNIGQTFNGSIIDMRTAARTGNLTIESFSKALLEGSLGLRQLGGIQFAALSKGLRDSLTGVADFGMTIDQTNSALSDYLEMQRFTSDTNNLTQANVNKNFADMITNATGLSAAFGVARDQILKDSAAVAKDPNIQALLSGVDPSKRASLNAQIGTLGAVDPTLQKQFLEALSVEQGKPTREAGIDYAANAPLMEGLQRAIEDFNSGKTTNMISGLQAAGKAGADYVRSLGPITQYANSTNAFGQSVAGSAMTSDELLHINAQAGNAAEGDINKPAPETLAAERLLESYNKILVTQEAIVTDLMKDTSKSSTVLMNDFNTLADKSPAIAAKFDTLSGTLSKVDTAFAKLLTDMGPAGVGITAALALAAANITNIAGTILTAKAAIDIAKKVVRPPAPPSGKANAARRGAKLVGEEGEELLTKAGTRTASSQAEGFLARNLGRIVGFGLEAAALPLDIAIGTALDAHNNKLNVGENWQSVAKASSDKQQQAGGITDKTFQRMSDAERADYEKLKGDKRDAYIREKAASYGIAPNTGAATATPGASSTGSTAPTPVTVVKSLSHPNSAISGLTDPTLPPVDPNASLQSMIDNSNKLLAAMQKQADLAQKQLDAAQVSYQINSDLLSKIESNTHDTSKNVIRTGNRL